MRSEKNREMVSWRPNEKTDSRGREGWSLTNKIRWVRGGGD